MSNGRRCCITRLGGTGYPVRDGVRVFGCLVVEEFKLEPVLRFFPLSSFFSSVNIPLILFLHYTSRRLKAEFMRGRNDVFRYNCRMIQRVGPEKAEIT